MSNRTTDDIASAISALDAAIHIIRAEASHAATTHDIDMLRFAQTVLRGIVARIEERTDGVREEQLTWDSANRVRPTQK